MASERIKTVLKGRPSELGSRLETSFKSIYSTEAWDMTVMVRERLSKAQAPRGSSSDLRLCQLCLPGLFQIPRTTDENGPLVGLLRELIRRLAGRRGLAWDMANEVVLFDARRDAMPKAARDASVEKCPLVGLPGLLRHLSNEELWEVASFLKFSGPRFLKFSGPRFLKFSAPRLPKFLHPLNTNRSL